MSSVMVIAKEGSEISVLHGKDKLVERVLS